MNPVNPYVVARAKRVGETFIVSLAVMPRTDLYIKVEIEVDGEDPKRLAAEICRQIQKVYGVRSAELTNYVQKD
jgi:hypothetical protein